MSEYLIYKKPVTPGLRHSCLLNKSYLIKLKRLKNQSFFKKNNAGRNNKGRITCYTKGGGNRKLYRKVMFKPSFSKALIEAIEYDPYRTANIARIFCKENKKHFYILAASDLKPGHIVYSYLKQNVIHKNFKIGNTFFLKDIPLGFFIYNICFLNKKSGGYIRAAGTNAQIISRTETSCRVRLRSGEYKNFSLFVSATIGTVSNMQHNLVNLGKAGRSRWLNRRPSVRGVAMNPIDHPHGGGEGKSSGGRPSVTPWGKVAHGQPTKKKKKKMATSKRSKWKGPYIDSNLLDSRLKEGEKKMYFKTKSRNTEITPCFFNRSIDVYNGRVFVNVNIHSDMGGHKLGEFSYTRKRHIYVKKKKKKK